MSEETRDAGQETIPTLNLIDPDTMESFGGTQNVQETKEINEPEGTKVDESEEKETEEVSDTKEQITDVPNKENPSRFEYWQSKFGKEQAERERIERELSEIREQVQTFQTVKPKEQEPELRMPEEPIVPREYDPTDAVTDVQSSSYKYDQAYKKYLSEMVKYQNVVLTKQTQAFESERKQREQSEYMSKAKAHWMGEFVKAGAEPDEAAKIFEFASSADSTNPANIVKYFRILNNIKQKGTTTAKKGELSNVPMPPTGGKHEDKPDPSKQFLSDLLEYSQNPY